MSAVLKIKLTQNENITILIPNKFIYKNVLPIY